MTSPHDLLVYFDRLVLTTYRAQSDRYVVFEDDMGGEVSSKVDLSDDSSTYVRIRFGFRLDNAGKRYLAVFGPDLQKLPEDELNIWIGHHRKGIEFSDSDPQFDRWFNRTMQGSWESEDGPIRSIEIEIEFINAISEIRYGQALFKWPKNPALHYPVAQNTESLINSQVELYKLLVDGLNGKVLKTVADQQGTNYEKGVGTLNLLKALLPDDLKNRIHPTLIALRESRNQVHKVTAHECKATDATEQFDKLARDSLVVVRSLKRWLADISQLNPEATLRFQQATQLFPQITSKLRPDFKHDEFERLTGKTIKSVQAGGVKKHPDCHVSEALIIEFTDGTSCAMCIGSNSGNISMDFECFKPNMFDADLRLHWAPDPSRPLESQD